MVDALILIYVVKLSNLTSPQPSPKERELDTAFYKIFSKMV